MNICGYDFLEHPLTKHCKMKLPMITCFVTMRCNHVRYCPTDDLHDLPQGAKLDGLVSCRGDEEHVEVVGDDCQ